MPGQHPAGAAAAVPLEDEEQLHPRALGPRDGGRRGQCEFGVLAIAQDHVGMEARAFRGQMSESSYWYRSGNCAIAGKSSGRALQHSIDIRGSPAIQCPIHCLGVGGRAPTGGD